MGRLAHVTAIALLAAPLWGCGGDEPAAPKPATEQRAETGPAAVTTPAGIEMASIPAGEFTMGDRRGADDEQPARTVTVSGFLMDRHEVTQTRFEELMGRNPSNSKGPDKPVEQISWLLAAKYCNARSLREGLTPCYDPATMECDFSADGYRLPTEAEWEYACRAGTGTRYSFGNDPRELRRHAWFDDNAQDATHPVGGKQPNPWGLFDMHGNVAEWCHDSYDEAYYAAGETRDPRGPAGGDERVLRGGAFNNTEDACRSAARYSEPPGLADVCFGYDAYGFRCVRRLPADGVDGGQ